MNSRHIKWWILWLLLSGALGGYYGYAFVGDDKAPLLPGLTSHGHYQIELACDSCHGDAFGGSEALQESCVRCHAEELKVARDSHPRSKFTDPRNADRVALLDARYCVTCHREHKPEVTGAMGVTLPDDLCFTCHQEVAKERPSHKGMAFDSCASAGCHNYHDNQALYENFLVKHGDEPAQLKNQRVAQRNLHQWSLAVASEAVVPLEAVDADAPAAKQLKPEAFQHWINSAHSDGGVNCSDCHLQKDKSWIDRPGVKVCEACHGQEVQGFTQGKHGMRLARGMSPMVPVDARLPMKAEAHNRSLDCNSCHGAHSGDLKQAAVESCLSCHNDEHSKNYPESAHARLWQQEQSGKGMPGSGVSCATCHMPREAQRLQGEPRIAVQHNQSLNLRPNEKMVRGVCMSCHGYEFSINALADAALIKNNFSALPSVAIESTRMALAREAEKGSRSK